MLNVWREGPRQVDLWRHGHRRPPLQLGRIVPGRPLSIRVRLSELANVTLKPGSYQLCITLYSKTQGLLPQAKADLVSNTERFEVFNPQE